MKMVTIEAFFPELKGNPYETAKGKAGSVPLATKRAMQNLWAKDRIKGKRLTIVKATITIVNVDNADNQIRYCVQRNNAGTWEHVIAGDGGDKPGFASVLQAHDWINDNVQFALRDKYRVAERKVKVQVEKAQG